MSRKLRYYFIGIKGAGMSALANVLKKLGHEVAGSDIDTYVFTERQLLENGVTVLPFDVKNVQEHTYDVIVRGAVFTAENNAEVAYAEAQNLCVKSYHEMLRDLSNKYISVAVSGTHGKTTTTGMLAAALQEEPIAYLIGDGTGDAHADSSYFLFESCEYKRHFLWYTPDYQIITNIDFDHPDYFADTADVVDAFVSSALQVKRAVVTFGDDPQVQKMIDIVANRVQIVTFGEQQSNDYVITNYQPSADGITFDLQFKGRVVHFTFPFYGKHMMLNAVSTLVVADLEGLDLMKVAMHLATFSGVDRRFNVKEVQEYTLVDDYAHHPNEIDVTLAAARQRYPQREIVAIFQPHTFSRTSALAADFAKALQAADEVYVTDIFTSARESGDDVNPKVIIDAIPGAKHLVLDDVKALRKHTGSVLIFMGAGNIQNYIKKFSELIEKV